MTHSSFSRTLAMVLSCLMLLTGLQSTVASAALVSSSELVRVEATQFDRDQLSALMQRQQAVTTLQTMGVDPTLVQERIQSMTAEELQAFNTQVDQMQAGGSALGVVVLIFLILILLDLLGVTNIFPAIR